MAYFNEDNVTEQMCIEIAKQAGYQYCGADELREAKNDVIVEPLLQEALIWSYCGLCGSIRQLCQCFAIR